MSCTCVGARPAQFSHLYATHAQPEARQNYFIIKGGLRGPQNNETIAWLSQAHNKHAKHVADFQLNSNLVVYSAGK